MNAKAESEKAGKRKTGDTKGTNFHQSGRRLLTPEAQRRTDGTSYSPPTAESKDQENHASKTNRPLPQYFKTIKNPWHSRLGGKQSGTAPTNYMFKKWWDYEWLMMRRAATETSFKTFFGGGFLIGILAYWMQMKVGLRTPHDTWLFVLIGFGCAAVGVLCGFLLTLFTLPAKMANEQQRKHDSAVAEQQAKFETSIASKDQMIQSLQSEIEKYKKQIEDDRPRLIVSAAMKNTSVGHFMYGRLRITIKNVGRNIARVESVFIYINTTTPNGARPEAPVETEARLPDGLPEGQRYLEVLPNGGMNDWDVHYDRNQDFAVRQTDEGKRGYGYIQLTTTDTFQFEFNLLSDVTWNLIAITNAAAR
jgi:hypothetical protein